MEGEQPGNYYPDNRAILGSEYCSGYIDSAGDWHTGFYCPVSDDNINIFCCGGMDNKYCCTKKDQVVQEEVEGLTLLLGCMLGVLTACLMVTMAGCLICPWCPAYRRRRVIKHKSHTWNRLPHAESGTTAISSHRQTSQSLPSLYHSSPAPVKSITRDTVLHSPTLPHSLSDHIGVTGDGDGQDYKESRETISGVSLALCDPGLGLEQSLRNLHYTLPRGAYIVIPHHTQDLLSPDFNKPYPEDCADDSLLFSTKF